MPKSSPALLLTLLVLAGAGAAVWMSPKNGAPVEVKTAPVAPVEPSPLLEATLPTDQPDTAPQINILVEPKPSGPPKPATMEGLRQQIALLEGQVEYLQGQVGALQDENAQLLQKLGTLGMKGVAKLDPLPPLPMDEPPDFVGLGIELMKFRQIQALPIPTTGVSQAEVEKAILAWLRQQQPEDEGPRFALALTALGWIPKPVDPLPLQASVLALNLGGWYDTASGTLLVVDEKAVPGKPAPDRPMAVAFGQLLREYGSTLYPAPGKPPLTTDERLARLALITGDAALTRFLYSIQNPIPQSPTDLPAEDPDHPLNQIPMPMYLKELSLFPFAKGLEFAQALHSAGLYPQLNASYSRPPTSCGEIIEPERFLDPERLPPARVDLPNIEIGDEKPYWDDRLGRFATFTALRTYNSDEEAGLATRGQKGDRLLAYAAPNHKRDHAVWQSLFMTFENGTAFFKAMRSCVTQRYDAKPEVDDPGKVTLKADDRHVRILSTHGGQGVMLIDAATAEFADAAEKAASSLR